MLYQTSRDHKKAVYMAVFKATDFVQENMHEMSKSQITDLAKTLRFPPYNQ